MLSCMTSIQTCRIGFDPVCLSILTYDMLEYSLCCRGTAYVSQAHEKDFVFIADRFHYLTIILSILLGTDVRIS